MFGNISLSHLKLCLAAFVICSCNLITACPYTDQGYDWRGLIEKGEMFGGFRYKEENGTIKILLYEGRGGAVNIPGEINGKPVTSIGYNAFMDAKLTGVTIPDSVTSIGLRAFNDNQLTGVTIPDGVIIIDIEVFANNRLTGADIPDGITNIRNGAFSYNRLTYAYIPGGVTSLGDNAFRDNRLASVIIPGSVTLIGMNAFANNQLTSVIIPDSVTRIGHSAFSRNQLTNITIGAGVTVDHSFGSGFEEIYNDGGRQAGTYTRANTSSAVWTRQ